MDIIYQKMLTVIKIFVYSYLPEAISTLQMAAINLFFHEDNEEASEKKEQQMLLIKAAQYGKSFVQIGDFNFEKYVERCRDLRIIYSLRNLKKHHVI